MAALRAASRRRAPWPSSWEGAGPRALGGKKHFGVGPVGLAGFDGLLRLLKIEGVESRGIKAVLRESEFWVYVFVRLGLRGVGCTSCRPDFRRVF